MKLNQIIKIKISIKWLLSIAAIFLGIFILVVISSIIFTYKYQGQIYPGVKINGYDLGGLTIDQADNIILGNINPIFEPGLTFKYQDTIKNIPINHEQNILTIHNENMARQAFEYARQGNFIEQFKKKIVLLLKGAELPLDYQFNKNKLKENLKLEFGSFENPARNSQVEIDIIDPDAKKYELIFTEENDGTELNYIESIEILESEIKNFKNPEIVLEIMATSPQITKSQAENYTEQIHDLLALKDIKLVYGEKTFEIDWEDYAYWVGLGLDDKQEISLKLKKEMLQGQLESIAQHIDQEAKNARFQMKDGRVIEFQGSQKGLEVNQEDTYTKINQEITENKNTTIELVVNEVDPEITTDSINDLGINELIGVGTSNFSGSPSNRRHNIGVGAATFNGLLIKPDEEFSVVNALGEIDASTGYLAELVIKDNKTIPEFGGGLCQVATTIFRVVLDTGLPITERSPHSYRVSYYEPAGTDATIYQPHPDLRFINDTGHYILIQTFIKGNELKFEFWGTSDGRQVELTDPQIFNITYPGPTKIVETADLAPGQKKCTESAHAGADAVFYQTITRADGTEEKITWSSHYTPWRAVCLVGIDPDKPIEDGVE